MVMQGEMKKKKTRLMKNLCQETSCLTIWNVLRGYDVTMDPGAEEIWFLQWQSCHKRATCDPACETARALMKAGHRAWGGRGAGGAAGSVL